MCLENAKEITKESEKSGFGYKVFKVCRDKLHSPVMGHELWVGVWNFALARFVDTDEEDIGFHIFTRKKDAKKYCECLATSYPADVFTIKKVEYKRATFKGVTNCEKKKLPTIVAKKMRVCKEKE